ncbi:hypothetical protein D9M71_519100 [compost metagenome]
MGQAALVLQPVVALLAQLADAVAGEEVRIDAAAGGLPVHRLGAVLAELHQAAFRRLAPGAAGAVEAAVLVGLEHGADVLHRVLAAQPAPGDALQRAPAGGGAVVGLDVVVEAHEGVSMSQHARSAWSQAGQAITAGPPPPFCGPKKPAAPVRERTMPGERGVIGSVDRPWQPGFIFRLWPFERSVQSLLMTTSSRSSITPHASNDDGFATWSELLATR